MKRKATTILKTTRAAASVGKPTLTLTGPLYEQRKAAYYAQIPAPTKAPLVYYYSQADSTFRHASVNKTTDSFTVSVLIVDTWLQVTGYPGNTSDVDAHFPNVQATNSQQLSPEYAVNRLEAAATAVIAPVSSTQRIMIHPTAATELTIPIAPEGAMGINLK